MSPRWADRIKGAKLRRKEILKGKWKRERLQRSRPTVE